MLSTSLRYFHFDAELPTDEIHIWYARLDQPISVLHKFAQTLSTDEQMRARRFRFAHDRKRFIICRGILRTILGCYLRLEPSRLRFCYGNYGKPALANTCNNGGIHFNLSRSEGLALYGFTRHLEVGVDIEHIREIPEMDQIVERFFSPKENDAFRALPETEKRMVFFNCWTRKEAFIKAKGEGLRLGLNQFEVSLAPGEPAALVSINGDPHEVHRWSLRELYPGNGRVATLASESNGSQIKCWQWEGDFR